jgi:hypothetical protein
MKVERSFHGKVGVFNRNMIENPLLFATPLRSTQPFRSDNTPIKMVNQSPLLPSPHITMTTTTNKSDNYSNNENGLEISEDLIESNWDKVTDK